MKKDLKTKVLVLITIILGIVAILTAIKIRQMTNTPVAPNVPESKPLAATGDKVCSLYFAVVSPPPGLRCASISLDPVSPVITSNKETRSLTANSTGGSGSVTFTWVVTTNKTNKGTLSAASGKTITWTVPTTFVSGQTWTIVATAKDASGIIDSSGCTVLLTYQAPVTPTITVTVTSTPKLTATPTLTRTPTPTSTSTPGPSPTPGASPTPTPTTPPGSTPTPTPLPSPTPTGVVTHRVCSQNNQCVIISGAGADQCTSDVSCQPTITPPVMPTVGTNTPTLGLMLGGGLLLLIGLSLLVL